MSGLLLILGLPLLGTVLGSSFVFFLKNDMPRLVQKALLGFASGVMVAAAVWSLIIPAMNLSAHDGALRVVPAAVGFIAGMAFLLLIDHITPHLHLNGQGAEGPRCHLSKTTMLALAVTIHNLPEGMAVGVVAAGMLQHQSTLAASAALAVSVGIAIQNIPEGAIVSMPMRSAGNRRLRSFVIGALSGVVEPIGALLIIALASALTPVLPYLLAFAAGAMLYVVVEELIPEASAGEHSNVSTVGFALGFTLMMVLDVVLG